MAPIIYQVLSTYYVLDNEHSPSYVLCHAAIQTADSLYSHDTILSWWDPVLED